MTCTLFCFSGVSLYHYLEATDPASNPPDYVMRYAKFLKDIYKEMSVLPDPDWPPAIATKDHYTNLAIIERERDSYVGDDEVRARDYAHGRIDKIVGEKKPINLEETFFPIINSKNENRLTILMDGAPGVGKTTITRKLCIDWANGDILQEFYLVLLIPLRELKLSQQEVLDLSNILVGDDKALKNDILKYLETFSGSKALFIFDGFDELSYEQRMLVGNSLLVKLIKGTTLFRSSVIVTSRPYASKSLRDFQRVNRHVEVLGFTEKQITDCVSQNLSQENGEKLLLSLQERLDIKSLCYIPLNCRIVLFVYRRNNNELPNTLTQLYEIFILHTIKHFADRISSNPHFLEEIKEVHCYDALPSSVKDQLHSLSEMAFLGMQEDKLVFTRDDLQKLNLLSLGLLTSLFVMTNITEIKHFQFLHLTIQEFLAAKYLSSGCMTDKEVANFFRMNIWADRFRMTLLFLAGLTKFNFLAPNEALLEKTDHLLNNSRPKLLFLLQVLYESRNDTIKILSLLKAKLNMSEYTLSQFDLHVLLYTLSCTPPDYIWKEINLRKCDLSHQSLFTILSKKHAKNPNNYALGMTRTLQLTNNHFGGDLNVVIDFLTVCIFLENVKLPVLSDNYKVECTLSSKLCKVIAEHPSLQHLSFGGQRTFSKTRLLQQDSSTFPLCSKAFLHLLNFMDVDQLTHFKLFGYSGAFVDCAQCGGSGALARKGLCGLISRCQKLESLDLSNCKLPDDFMKAMTRQNPEVLKKYAKLKGNSELCDSYLSVINTWALDKKSPTLKLDVVSLRKLKNFQVNLCLEEKCGCKRVDILQQIFEAVESSMLKLYQLEVGILTCATTIFICQIVEESKTLHSLTLSFLTEVRATLQIFQVLQKSCSVRELTIWDVSDDRIERALSEVIVHNKMICTLRIRSSRCLIKSEGEFARSLLANLTLQNLYIGNAETVALLNKAIKKLREDGKVDVHPNWNLTIARYQW